VDKNQPNKWAFDKYIVSECYVPTIALNTNENNCISAFWVLNCSRKKADPKKVNKTIAVHNES
jgi:hypothetical protein